MGETRKQTGERAIKKGTDPGAASVAQRGGATSSDMARPKERNT
jgi:hypothetical protein